VNVFIWPASDGGGRSFEKDGFAVTEWTENGLRFAAVSDIPATELRQFEQLYRSRSK
jgi:anti-sigma factor RsiW